MFCTRLAQDPPYDLRYLIWRPHILVDIGKATLGIIPSLLKTQVENNVPVISCNKVVIVGIAP